jgi:hypothetical protein
MVGSMYEASQQKADGDSLWCVTVGLMLVSRLPKGVAVCWVYAATAAA